MKIKKDDFKHLIAIIIAVIIIAFLILEIPPYYKMIEAMKNMYTLLVGPIILFYIFFKTLDYRKGKIYLAMFVLGVIGFFGTFIEYQLIYKLTIVAWGIAFVYFPMMKYIEFTMMWFEKPIEGELHISKRSKLERKAERKFQRPIKILLIEDQSDKRGEYTIALMTPKEKPTYLLEEWDIKEKKFGRMKIVRQKWVGQRI